MKFGYIIACVVALLYVRGTKKAATDVQLQDTIASQKGSDWIGTAWERLSGSDLYAPGYMNESGSVSADFSKVNRRDQKILPAWNGGL